MPDYFCITIRFLGGAFHGRADHGEPEWPPSPLRLYQALVAASAARWNERGSLSHADSALRWLEHLPPPIIAAPPARESKGYRLYVPDNVGDLVAAQWSAGKYSDSKNHPIDIANYRTEKAVRPLVVPEESAVHYLWSLENLPPGFDSHRDILLAAAHSITHVGWGVDLAVAEVSVLDEHTARGLNGERWVPAADSAGTPLRIPAVGTLDDLNRRYLAFLNRISPTGGLVPVGPLTQFGIVYYSSATRAQRAPQEVFALRRLDDSGFRTYDPTRRGLHVAGMLRHAASSRDLARSVGWSDEDLRRIVLGHGESRGNEHTPVQSGRVAFLPLPSIENRDGRERVVGSIRRVLVAAAGDVAPDEFRRFTQRLDGRELVDEKLQEPTAVIMRQSTGDGAIAPYFDEASTWATVTPVILPGYDDPRKLRRRLDNSAKPLSESEKADVIRRLDDRIDHLLRKAIIQAGFSESMARYAELDWQSTGYWPGTAHAGQYSVPQQHRRYRRIHVRIVWRHSNGSLLKVAGPICIGGGKFTGLGLFAALR